MASTATSIYGNTLSDLQAGANSDKAVTFSRQQAAADRALQMSQLLQQDRQFGTSEANRMKLGQLNADTQKAIAESDAKARLQAAKDAAAARQIDPKSIAELEAFKLEQQNLQTQKRQLSDARRAAESERKQLIANKRWWDIGQPNDANAIFTSRRFGELNDIISKLDAAASQLGLAPSPDGGYAGFDVPAALAPQQGQAAVPGAFQLTPSEYTNSVVGFPALTNQNAPPVNRFMLAPNGAVIPKQ